MFLSINRNGINQFLLNYVSLQKTNTVTFLACISNTIKAQNHTDRHLTSFVDPYIGSGGHGHVFVGASVPFGAVQLGPENFYKGWDWCSGYNYGDSVLIGFAHTHLSGTGIGDLGDILIMPYTGQVKTDKGIEKIPGSGYASHYSHKNEQVKPGYYSVKLDASGIGVATARLPSCGNCLSGVGRVRSRFWGLIPL